VTARHAWILLPLLSVLPFATAEAGSSLAAWRSGTWSTWWRSEQAPTRWESSDPVVTSALRWQPLAQGLEWASLRMRCGPVPTRLVLVRLDPTRVHLSLEMARSASGRPAWTIDDAPDDALLAMNAGQFVGTMPWGWVVIDGVPQLSDEYVKNFLDKFLKTEEQQKEFLATHGSLYTYQNHVIHLIAYDE